MSNKNHQVFVGLGSNLDGPETQLRTAVRDLHGIAQTRVLRCSSLYRSAPMGPADQPDYVNAAVSLSTHLDPFALLAQLQEIENRHGRVRPSPPQDSSTSIKQQANLRWGPRTLDLDLLLYDDRVIATETLTIPHPGVHQRDFVLIPLQEIAPQQVIPGRGHVADLVAALPAGDIIAIGEPELP